MAFVARKPFTHNGTRYAPGDVINGFPGEFFRSEGFIRGGFVVEKDVPKPKRKIAPVEVKPLSEAPLEEE